MPIYLRLLERLLSLTSHFKVKIMRRRSSTSESKGKSVDTPAKYKKGQRVLARLDSRFSLATITKVDNHNNLCMLQFEDDQSMWCPFKEIENTLPDEDSDGSTESDEIVCQLCQGEYSRRPNEIVLCDRCGQGYHQHCHKPYIEVEFLVEGVEWRCHKCSVPKIRRIKKIATKRRQPSRTSKDQIGNMSVIKHYKTSTISKDQEAQSKTKDCDVPTNKEEDNADFSDSKHIVPQRKIKCHNASPQAAINNNNNLSLIGHVHPSFIKKEPREIEHTTSVHMESLGTKGFYGKSVSPKSVVQSATPKSVVQSATPKSVVQSAPIKSVVQNAPSKSVVQKGHPKSDVQSAHPKSDVQNVHPKSVVQSAPQKNSVQSVPTESGVAPTRVVENVSPKSIVNGVSPKSEPLKLVGCGRRGRSRKRSREEMNGAVKAKVVSENLSQSKAEESTPKNKPALIRKQSRVKLKEISSNPKSKTSGLPYDDSRLSWNDNHQFNTQGIYCYCGKDGEWFKKMVQCSGCRQWFHEACVSCLSQPLLYGDHFYIFMCKICNNGQEFVQRIDLKWVDIAHLVLFNLTLEKCTSYSDVDEEIVPWMTNNWKTLNVGKHASASNEVRVSKLLHVLTKFKKRFKCASECGKRKSLWSLRTLVVPPAPTYTFTGTPPIKYSDIEGFLSTQLRDREKANPRPANKRKSKLSVIPKEQMMKSGIGNIHYLYVHKRPYNATHKEEKQPPAKRRKLDQSAKENKGKKRKRTATQDDDIDEGIDEPRLSQHYNGYEGSITNYTLSRKSLPKAKDRALSQLIPAPEYGFEDLNNPFLTDLEKQSFLAVQKRKEGILNVLLSDIASDSGCGTSDVSCSNNSKLKRSESFSSVSTLSSFCSTSKLVKDRAISYSDLKAMNGIGRKNGSRLSTGGLELKILHNSENAASLRSKMVKYFGAADRLAKGEKFTVQARRISSEGKAEYLVEWGKGVLH